MQQNLQGAVAVITGGGGGIGRATAEKLAEEGMTIVLLGGNNQEKLSQTVASLGAEAKVLALPGNLIDLDFLKESIKKIIDTFGTIDVLINNAGVALSCPFSATTEAQYDNIMEINVKVPFFLTQYALPYLKQSQRASIINISSVVGHLGYPLQSAYAASKHAILGFTKSLANECYQDNIRVHAISPGGVYTDMVKIARPDLTPNGMILPEDIANIVYFFLANRGNAVVDEILVHRVNKEPFQVS